MQGRLLIWLYTELLAKISTTGVAGPSSAPPPFKASAGCLNWCASTNQCLRIKSEGGGGICYCAGYFAAAALLSL